MLYVQHFAPQQKVALASAGVEGHDFKGLVYFRYHVLEGNGSIVQYQSPPVPQKLSKNIFTVK